MTFDRTKLTCTGNNGGADDKPNKSWLYSDADGADDLAAVSANGFFGTVIAEGVINDDDTILIRASDNVAMGIFSATTVIANITVDLLDVNPNA